MSNKHVAPIPVPTRTAATGSSRDNYFPVDASDYEDDSSDEEGGFLGFSFSPSTWRRKRRAAAAQPAATSNYGATSGNMRTYKQQFNLGGSAAAAASASGTMPREPAEEIHRRRGSINNRVVGYAMDEGDGDAQKAINIPARLVDKDTGDFRVKKLNRGNLYQYYFKDPFHTLVDSPWWRIAILVVCLYVILYNLFAGLYIGFSFFCEYQFSKYSDAFLFSLQVHMSLGYGIYQHIPTTECPGVVTIVTIQCLVALVLNAILFGLVYAKFSRPTLRKQTLWFSNNALITKHNGRSSLIFRIANIRKSEIIEARVRLLMGYAHQSRDGSWEYAFVALPMTTSTEIMLAVPWTVVHPITRSSPLYQKSVDELRKLNVEIICFVHGVNAETGDLFQKRHSYTADEIVFHGHFATILSKNMTGQWVVNFARFHEIIYNIPDSTAPPADDDQSGAATSDSLAVPQSRTMPTTTRRKPTSRSISSGYGGQRRDGIEVDEPASESDSETDPFLEQLDVLPSSTSTALTTTTAATAATTSQPPTIVVNVAPPTTTISRPAAKTAPKRTSPLATAASVTSDDDDL